MEAPDANAGNGKSSTFQSKQPDDSDKGSHDTPIPQQSLAEGTHISLREVSSKSAAPMAKNAYTNLGRGDVADYFNFHSGSKVYGGHSRGSSISSQGDVPMPGPSAREVLAFDKVNVGVALSQPSRRHVMERSYSAKLTSASVGPGRTAPPAESSAAVTTSPSLSTHTQSVLDSASGRGNEIRKDDHTSYLYPTLTDCERERLNKLWYVTQGIEDDESLRDQLGQLASIARETTGYGIAIIGLLDNDAYIRIAAEGAPLAVLSRREATCAHTILQTPGTVFSVPSMRTDERFKNSPHVKEAGLQSYAGTSLIYEVPNSDEKVPFGSLCVADYSERDALTESEQMVLVRLARAVMNTIMYRANAQRQQVQRKMQEHLTQLSNYQSDNSAILKEVNKALKSVFPGNKVSFVESQDGHIELNKVGPVAIKSFRNNVWENTDYFERFIAEKNHTSSRGLQSETIRAIAVGLPRSHAHHFLIETADLRQVYDETDTMFVRSCAMIACNGLQAGLLRKALDAKVAFLRSVQHSFRTSLNGILSASEMLLDEEKEFDAKLSERSFTPRSLPNSTFSKQYQPEDARSVIMPLTRRSTASTADMVAGGSNERYILRSASSQQSSLAATPGERASRATNRSARDEKGSLLNIIDTSGRALLTIINNLIHFDASSQLITAETNLCNLFDVEEEVLNSVLLACSFRKQTQVALQVMAYQLPDHVDVVMTDDKLLRQALTALVQNAMDNTEKGLVQLSSYINSDTGSLVFDVKDTGCGIPLEDIDRIFQPFEKVDTFSQNAGLGLTFAARYATTLGGTVSVVSTAIGQGTVMRLDLPNPVFACTRQRRDISRRFLRWKYYVAESSESGEERQLSEESMIGISRYLELAGLKRTDNIEEARIILVDSEESRSRCAQRLERTTRYVFVTILPLAENYRRYLEYNPDDRLFYLGLPLCRSRVAACLEQAKWVLKHDDTKNAAFRRGITATAEWTNAVAAAADATSSRMSDTSDAPPLQTLHCLLVDDNDTNLSILQKYCKKRKFAHEIARDGNEAFEQYRRLHQQGQPITCCLMDLQMPHCDGIQSTSYIRNYEKEHGLRPSKIFMVSGQSGDEERNLALAAGCDGYYVKPLRIKALDELLALHFHI